MLVGRSYKEEHEAFVANLKGTSVGCIVACVLHIPAFLLLTKLAQRSRKPRLLREFVFMVLPLLLSITILAEYNYWSLALLTFSLMYLYGSQRRRSSYVDSMTSLPGSNGEVDKNEKTSYLTLFKGMNMLLTCLAILAVDFRVFPRRFAKTETFGMSLMDIGVGTFVISSAFTSRYARGIDRGGSPQVLPLRRLAVLLLGLSRLISVKLLNYQEHVTEYGVHWNFFLTLFSVWTIADALHYIFPRRRVLLLIGGLGLLLTYQFLLCQTDLTEYLFSNQRRNTLIDANKEGIFSLLGYVPMFLLGEVTAFKLFYFPPNIAISSNPTRELSAGNSLNDSLGSSSIRRGVSSATKAASTNNHSPPAQPPTLEGDTGDPLYYNLTDAVLVMEEEGLLPTGTIGSMVDAVTSTTASAISSATSAASTGSKGQTTNESGSESDTSPLLGSQGHSHQQQYVSSIPWDRPLVRRLSLYGILAWIAWAFCATTLQPTSRRLCNAAFVSLCMALSLTLTLTLYIADTLGGRSVPVITIKCLADHQLPVFLIANLLTGAVNMIIRTIYAPPALAVLLLSIYAFLVTCTAWFADFIIKYRAKAAS